MSKVIPLAASIFAACLCVGCGTSEPAAETATPAHNTAVTPVTLREDTADAEADLVAVVEPEPEPAPEFELRDESFNPFAPPPPPEEPLQPVVEEKPKTATAPEVQLLGFIKVIEAKAILKIGDNVSNVVTGDTIEEVTLVAINKPDVTLKFKETEWTVSLFRQPEARNSSLKQSARRRNATGPRPPKRSRTSFGTVSGREPLNPSTPDPRPIPATGAVPRPRTPLPTPLVPSP